VLLVAVLFRAAPKDFLPWWTDEVVYWNEIVGIANVGWNGGYVTVYEQPPRARLLRAGPHGPVFPALYAGIARLFGWRSYSPYLVNLALITAGLAVWIEARGPLRPSEIIVIATFWPLLLYLPTAMQEPMHFTLAALVAAATWCMAHGGRRRMVLAGAIGALAVGAMARPTWGLMLIPLVWPHVRGSRPRIALALIAAATLTLVAQLILGYTAAPFPNEQSALFSLAGTDPVRALQALLRRTGANTLMFVDPRNGEISEVALRYIIIAVSVVLLMEVRRRIRFAVTAEAAIVEAAALGLILPLPAVLALGWVESWRDFRMLAPHLLYALLLAAPLAVTVRRVWWVSLVALPAFVLTFIDFHQDRFTTSRQEIDQLRGAVAPLMVPDAAGPPWSRTILVSADLLQYQLLGLPPGISVSFVLDWEKMHGPLHSRYLLLRPQDKRVFPDPLHVTALAETPLGTLYRNLDAP